ncbi:DNA topoisomerase 3 [Facklamia sp. P12955]|uniref:DNA topoisomerase 3 n=1 Tax=Facklamia sp. P12955 TaxID=3421946 RepID=UPI003D183F4D
MRLVIAEKPSVALTIAKVIGANKRNNGYYSGNGFYVSWCVGHLVGLASPDKYDKKYAKWTIEDLPILPKEYMYEINPRTKKQFNLLKKLMARKDVEVIVNACDAGREGEAIFRYVYDYVKCKKKIERLWISSMEDQAIREGFYKLEDGEKYENLYESAKARAMADWLVGMNISRLYSCLYKQNYSVGRVQTPTLNMIVTRDQEIEHFKKEKYYTVEIKLKDFSLSTQRIDDIETAKQLRNLIDDQIEIDDVIEKEKVTKPDKLYDLTTLQREANKIYGFSAKETLDLAQKLYERKLISYPRTDSRYLTLDMKEKVDKYLFMLKSDLEIDEKNFLSIFDSKKVSDHYAIIPTEATLDFDFKKLSEDEKKIYRLIEAKLLMSASKSLVESMTKVIYVYDGMEFTASGKTIIEEGFKQFDLSQKKNEKNLPVIKKGDIYDVKETLINEKYTQPPKAYTEDSLLKAMEIAGNKALDKEVEVERKGIGTPATRAGIIENLIYKGFIERDKKNLISTHKGVSLVAIVGEEFKSAETTANWEMKLSDIAKGKLSKEEFLSEIEGEIKNSINKYKNKIED